MIDIMMEYNVKLIQVYFLLYIEIINLFEYFWIDYNL